jgi:hypothetical protein
MNTSDLAEVPILVVSCDRYQDVWDTFFHLFFKYWPECPFPIYLVSNCLQYHDSRVKSILVGPDQGYSSNLIKALDQLNTEWIIFWIDDRPPCQHVNTKQLLDLLHLGVRRRVAYLKLLDFHPYALVPEHEMIGELPGNTRYLVSLTIALWNRRAFLEMLRPGQTAWEIERPPNGRRIGPHSGGFFSISIGWRGRAPIHDLHLITKGRVMRGAIRYLRKEHLNATLLSRKKASLGYSLYIRLNHLIWDVYYKLRWHTSKNNRNCNVSS